MTKSARWRVEVEIPERKSMSKKQRADFFTRHGGICHFCNEKIASGERWERSHLEDLEISGDDSDANARPAHYKCHREYTYGPGIKRIAKVRRLRKKETEPKPVGRMHSRGFQKDGPKRKIPSRPWAGKVS